MMQYNTEPMKTRITIIALSSILLGFVLGFFVNGRLTHQRMERIVHQQEPDGMKVRMMKIIQPTEDQIRPIETILDEHTERVHLLRKMNREKVREAHKQMRDALHEVLTPEQEERLKQAHKRMFNRRRPPHHERLE